MNRVLASVSSSTEWPREENEEEEEEDTGEDTTRAIEMEMLHPSVLSRKRMRQWSGRRDEPWVRHYLVRSKTLDEFRIVFSSFITCRNFSEANICCCRILTLECGLHAEILSCCLRRKADLNAAAAIFKTRCLQDILRTFQFPILLFRNDFLFQSSGSLLAIVNMSWAR